MSRSVKVLVPSEVRKRGFKLLLYADNRQHMRILSKIRRTDGFRQSFVGCWHIQRDDSGAEIVKGADKKHCHIILSFSNPRYWSSILSTLDVSEQFCRPIGLDRDSIEGGLIYLVHANAPDKEQYSVADLFGSPDMVAAAERAINDYKLRHVSLSESLLAIREWINSQFGQIITYNYFVKWACSTPYVRTACSNPLVREMIKAHNYLVANAENKAKFQEISAGYEKLQSLYGVEDWFRDTFGMEELTG